MFTFVLNNGTNSLFIFSQIVKQDRIQIVESYARYRAHKAENALSTDIR